MQASSGERRIRARAAALGCAAALTLVAGCGGGEERQDANEPEGIYKIEVVKAEFPDSQKLAKASKLEIVVKNVDQKTIPNIAVTVKGFDRRKEDPRLADPERPVFVINGNPEQIGGLPESRQAAPRGGDTAYVDTWALGRLRPGESKSFEWEVTAVDAGPYQLTYSVSAGLDGKAKARLTSGQPASGVFQGTIVDEPPDARVGDDGRTIVRE